MRIVKELMEIWLNEVCDTDSLSRRPDWEIGVERDNENEMLVKPEWLEVRRTETVEIVVEGVDLLEQVRQSKVKDDEVVKAVKGCKRKLHTRTNKTMMCQLPIAC